MSPGKSAYQDHPIFFLRRFLLVSSGLGLILSFISVLVENWWTSMIWTFTIFASCASILLVQFDFYDWKHHNCSPTADRSSQTSGSVTSPAAVCAEMNAEVQALLAEHRNQPYKTIVRDGTSRNKDSSSRGGDNDGEKCHRWPKKAVMIADFILVVLFAWFWFLQVGSIAARAYHYYHGLSELIQDYCTVCTILSAVLHAKCWWKEFMARKKQSWEDKRQDGEQSESVPSDDDLESGRRRYCHRCAEQGSPSLTQASKLCGQQSTDSKAVEHGISDGGFLSKHVFTPSISEDGQSSTVDQQSTADATQEDCAPVHSVGAVLVRKKSKKSKTSEKGKERDITA